MEQRGLGQPQTFRDLVFEEENLLYQSTKDSLFGFNTTSTNIDKNSNEFKQHKNALVEILKQNSRIFQSTPNENELRKEIYALIGRGELTIPKMYEAPVIEDYITEVHGYSIIDDLMKDKDVSDIQIAGPYAILYTKKGLTYTHDKNFNSNEEMMDFFQTKLEKTQFSFDRSKGSVDAYLPDGSRIHVKGEVTGYTRFDENGISTAPCNIVSIRKFLRDWTLQELIESGMLNQDIIDYIQIAFQLEYSCVVSGSVGSGKTSLINAMFELLSPIFTACVIEDSPEMKPHHPRCVRMWEKRSNNEERGSISISQNVIDTLRMNFKYVIIGETRTPDVAFEFIKSIDTGNSVCITSTHASDPYGAVMRMLFLAISSPSRPREEAVINQMRRMRLLIHARKMNDGMRRVTRVSELIGFNERQEPIIHDVFTFSMEDQAFHFHGVSGYFLESAKELNVPLPEWMQKRAESC